MARPAPLLLAAALAAMLALAPAAAAPAGADEHARKAAELAAVKERIETLKQRLAEMRGARSRAEQELEAHDRRVAAMAEETTRTEERIAATRGRLEDLRRQRDALETREERQAGALARQIRSAYLLSRQNPVKLLLNQDDPAAVQRALTYHEYINREYRARIAAIRERIARVVEVTRHIAAEEARLAELRRRQAEERARLDREQARRRALLERLSRDIASRGEELAHLRRNREELEHLLRELNEALADIPPALDRRRAFAGLRGTLPWPHDGRVLHPFGAARGLGNLRWQGVVLAGRPGDPVGAVHHGRVAFADWLRGFGLLLILDHGDGYMSLYGHNRTLLKDTGDWVEQGEPVATVGASGGLAVPGLYFEIRRNATPLDPRRWCRR